MITHLTNERTRRLDDALYALSQTRPAPDAAALEDLVRRYPEHAAELTTYAIELALDAIEDDPSEEAEILRLEYRAVLMQADDDPNGGIASGRLPADALRLRAIEAARKSIFALRNTEVIGDDAFHRLEEELDRAELSAGG